MKSVQEDRRFRGSKRRRRLSPEIDLRLVSLGFRIVAVVVIVRAVVSLEDLGFPNVVVVIVLVVVSD